MREIPVAGFAGGGYLHMRIISLLIKSDIEKTEKRMHNDRKHRKESGKMKMKLIFPMNEETKMYELCICSEKEEYTCRTPAELLVWDSDGVLKHYRNAYDSVREQNGIILCHARTGTENGSEFLFLDKYAIDCNRREIQMERTVEVKRRGERDVGFATEFALKQMPGEAFRFEKDCEVFVPGIWYGRNEGVVNGAFASDLYKKHFYFRITRMALPYLQYCNSETGNFISICHLAPVPDTGIPEAGKAFVMDSSLQYGSLGITKSDIPEIRYVYPGSEGEGSYIRPDITWAVRSHPVRRGIRHGYKLGIFCDAGENAYVRMRKCWRHWYDRYSPETVPCDLHKVYKDGIQVIDAYCQEYNSVMGLPFWVTVPEGNVSDISYQMGFVGQQTQCAWHLIRYGIQTQNEQMKEKGRQIIRFWVRESCRNSFLPEVWYQVFPPEFKKDYPSYLRTVADGMEGILNAYLYLKKHGEHQESWLNFCEKIAENLRKIQNEDGSFYRAYGKNGEPVHRGKYNTTNVIRFLVNLYTATGREEYADMALRAGEFCYSYIFERMAYIGGTADNDNTVDKEAGMQALYAFLAMYDLTSDARWIKAAGGAADFCETWTYSWKFPVHPFKGNGVFDKANQTGLSLIATGHSHCDVMMGYCPYDYFRLWLLTGDEHYKQFGRMILYNTKQTTDWHRRHGHSYPGLVEESGEIALQYHNGLGKWLPWCTIAEIEALARMEEWFGRLEIKEQDKDKITRKNINFSQFFDN